MACPMMRAALRMLTVRQIRGHLAKDLGIDDVPGSKLAATNMAIRLATQNAERLRFQWTVLGKKLSLGQLHGLTQGSCPKNKRAALEWLIESDVATCQGPTAVAAAASQMQRHRTHYATARKLLAKRLKRRGQQAVTPALLPTQPTPLAALPSQVSDLPLQIKTAVKTVLQLDGLGQTLVEVRRQVSALVGVDCASGAHMAMVDHRVNRLLAKRRAAVQAEDDAVRPKATFSRLPGLSVCAAWSYFRFVISSDGHCSHPLPCCSDKR
jgi:hypothetical protein